MKNKQNYLFPVIVTGKIGSSPMDCEDFCSLIISSSKYCSLYVIFIKMEIEILVENSSRGENNNNNNKNSNNNNSSISSNNNNDNNNTIITEAAIVVVAVVAVEVVEVVEKIEIKIE